MKTKTKLLFQMIKQGEDFFVDPNSIFINGYVFNWQMLNDFLFKKEDSNLPEIVENMIDSKSYEVELEIWEDSDDFRAWIDFDILSTSFLK
jgi:hypothetical protein